MARRTARLRRRGQRRGGRDEARGPRSVLQPVPVVEHAQRVDEDGLRIEPQMTDHVGRKDGNVVDGFQVVECELECAARPRDQLVDRALDLLLQGGVHRVVGERAVRHQDLSQRPARCLRRLLRERLLQCVAADGAALEEQIAEALRSRRPGADDAAAVEADLRLDTVALERERAGAPAEMDELQRIRYRDVFEVAGEAHDRPRRSISRA